MQIMGCLVKKRLRSHHRQLPLGLHMKRGVESQIPRLSYLRRRRHGLPVHVGRAWSSPFPPSTPPLLAPPIAMAGNLSDRKQPAGDRDRAAGGRDVPGENLIKMTSQPEETEGLHNHFQL